MEMNEEEPPELGAGSMWLLRIGSVLFLATLLYFLIDAIIG
ncbi:MAG: hypothetical protein ACI9C1_002236 [Candidatus Aldehydirespiratoraceae bacterium]|jgi:hypothetical protein